MKKNLCIASLLVFLVTLITPTKINAQSFEDEKLANASILKVDEESKLPTFVEFDHEHRPSLNNFFDWLRQAFQLNSNFEFSLLDVQADRIGQTHYRYQQHYNGFPIRSAHLILHVKEGGVIAFNGLFYQNSLNTPSSLLNESTALQKCIDRVGAEEYKWEIPEEEEFLKKELNDPTASFYPQAELVYFQLPQSNTPLSLCYRFDIYAQTPLSRSQYYIDAASGEIVYEEAKIKHGGNSIGQANTGYSGQRTIITDSLTNFFRLRDSTRGGGVETYDMNNSKQYSSAVDFIDSNNVWDTFSPSIDRYATDAHWATEMTYDYMNTVHNRNSIDNNGFTLKSYIHYDVNYVNAFWDGRRMTYGDGDATRSPLTTMDISAHEVAHGWTDYTSDLIYANESGALNESFSDILGFLVENYARPSNWNWTIGEDIGGAFRSMSNPNSYGNPDTYNGSFWVDQDCIPSSSNDRCGVHTNSGVQNHWFYLLAQGGLGINDVGDSIIVNGIGINNAADIAFRTNTVYLGPSSNYEDARFYSFRSAVDLFGACSAEVEDVINAWHGVGVGDAYQAGVSAQFIALKDTSFCRLPAEVEFKTFSSNIYDFYWDFGDGDTSTSRDPSHLYTTYGNFTVKLVADGGSCGIDSLERTAYISIDSTNDCSSFLTEQTQLNTNCTGTLYDDGGLNGSYSINRMDTFLISVSSADYIRLYFDFLDVEGGYQGACNHDYVEVFDGIGANAPSLGRFCNNNQLDSLESSANQLTVVFFSDNKNVGQGIQIRWACFQANQLAQFDFTSYPDTSCSGFAQFYSDVLGGYQQLEWDFGDGTTSLLRNPLHRYQQNGTYDVQLKVTNSQGTDSILKLNQLVVNRSNAPSVNGDSICINDEARLYASGLPNLNWYSSLISENSVHTGDSLILNRLSNSRSYYVASEPNVQSVSSVPFQIPGNTVYSDTAESIFFDVEAPLSIETMILRSSGRSGNRRIDVKDSTGRIIFSKLVYVSGSGSQVQLGARLYPGNNYELTIGNRDIGLLVNTTGASFPYQFGNLMQIHSSSLGPNAYPFFYFLRVKPLACSSIRARVTAFVDTNCVVTKVSDYANLNQSLEVYPIPFEDQLNISFPSNENSLRLLIFDAAGSLVYETNLNKNVGPMDLSFLKSDGIYFLRAIGSHGTYHQKLVKH